MIIALLAGIHALIIFRLPFFPYPELFVYSYLTDKGLLPYQQIIDQHFPGIMFFPVNLYSLGLNTPQHLLVVHMVLIVLNHVLIWKLSQYSLSGKWRYLPSVLYVIFQPMLEGNVLWIENFIVPIMLSSLYFLMRFMRNKQTSALLIHGFLLGLALVFKQVLLPLMIIVYGYIILSQKLPLKKILWYGIAMAAVPAFMLLYILSIGVFESFYYWTFLYNVTTFAEMGRKYATTGEILRVIPTIGAGIIAIFFTLRMKHGAWMSPVIIFFISSLLFAYARFDYIHLQPALPLSLILICFVAEKLPRQVFISLAVIYILGFVTLWGKFITQIPLHQTYFFTEFEQKLTSEVDSQVRDGETIFAMATTPHIYYLTETLPPGKRFVFQFHWFMVEAEDEILAGIQQDPPKMIIRDSHTTVAGENLVAYMPKINAYVNENYSVYTVIDGTELLKLKQ